MSDKEGFIVLHRKITDWEWYTDVNTAHLFMHFLIRANYSDTSWRGIEIKRGSFITSLETLSAETGLTVKQVRIALQKLIDTGEVANKSTSKFRIITVKNYDLYQIKGKQKGRQEGRLRADKRAVKGQPGGKQRATDNNNNNKTMETSEGVCPTGTQPSQKQASLDIDPPLRAVEPAPQTKQEKEQREKMPPLNTTEWLMYCERSGMSDDDIWSEWERLDNGRALSVEKIREIREMLSSGK